MREILFRGKRKDNGEWVCGMPWIFKEKSCICPWKKGMCKYDTGFFPVEVDPETVGQLSGVVDTELEPIFEGDIVRFINYVGQIIFQDGCFGIALDIRNSFDWDLIDEEMEGYAGTNQLTACFNDHFISLWEILWNFNCEENICNVIEVIGNIHDQPELLEVGA